MKREEKKKVKKINKMTKKELEIKMEKCYKELQFSRYFKELKRELDSINEELKIINSSKKKYN